MFQFYVKERTKWELTVRLKTKGNRRNNRGKLATFPEEVNKLLRTYANDEAFVEADTEITHHSKLNGMSLPTYAVDLWHKALRCGTVYTENFLKGVFIKELHEKISQSTGKVWGYIAISEIYELACHAKYKARTWKTKHSSEKFV